MSYDEYSDHEEHGQDGDDIQHVVANLAHTYYDEILKYVHWKVHGTNAEDITQEVFERASRYVLHRGGQIKSQRAFLRKIADRCIFDFYEDQKKKGETSLDDDTSLLDKLVLPGNVETDTESRDDLSKIARVIEVLPRQLRLVIELYMVGYKTKDIAHELHLKESSVRAYLAEARARIKPLIR